MFQLTPNNYGVLFKHLQWGHSMHRVSVPIGSSHFKIVLNKGQAMFSVRLPNLTVLSMKYCPKWGQMCTNCSKRSCSLLCSLSWASLQAKPTLGSQKHYRAARPDEALLLHARNQAIQTVT